MNSRTITVVASELLGRAGTGGAGTADSLLAVALGRHGHRVRLLVASGRGPATLTPEWAQRYDDANVEIRMLERTRGVSPAFLAPTLEVFHALRDDPPEVVIADDWRGLGFAALRARQTALSLPDTAFVIHCHGPGRVLAEFAQKVPDTLNRFGEEVTERTSIELADAVVSPTAWLLDWMRTHSWPVPESARVIPYVRQSAALDEIPEPVAGGEPIRRLAFFGQLREGKGIRIFLAALEALDAELLHGLELVFLGSARGRWAPENVSAALTPKVEERLGSVRFETTLERDAALQLLRTPGTLAVMPSLLDNAPNTVSESIEHGIPFLSTNVGGIPELVAEEDRAQVLCDATPAALAAALARALSSPTGPSRARAAHKPQESLDAWLDVVASVERNPNRAPTKAATRLAVVARGNASERRARHLADATTSADVEVVVAESRRAGLDQTAAEWIVFLDEDDEPFDELLDTLVAAQAAANADAVTVAVRPAEDRSGIRLFLGTPGSLGLLENHYGVLALVRRDLVAAQPLHESADDPDWPLLAGMALAGARIVSVPEAFSIHTGGHGNVSDVPGAGLAVLEAFESRPVDELHDLPELTATLGAALARSARPEADTQQPAIRERLRRRVGLIVQPSRPD